jgi:Zn-dependent protease with chaperone function
MFGNFIYFILVLLIYSTYQPSEDVGLSLGESLLLFALLAVAFAAFTQLVFRRIERRIDRLPFGVLDQMYHAALLRSSILAVAVFAVDIYGLGLPSFADDLPFMARVPTLQALLFIALFVGYLCVVWGTSYGVYRRLYQPDFSRRDYIGSNISFSVPVLLPWLLLSGVLDLLNTLPLRWLKRFLATTEGQVAYFSLFLIGVAVVGPALIKRCWRCTPLAQSPHRQRIEALCRRAGMPYADILNWPLFGGRMITAGVMGLVRRFRYILVTPSLLQVLGPDEIDAVIAHEIGHVKKKHLLFFLLFFAGYLLLSYVSYDLILYAMIFAEPVWALIQRSGPNQATVVSVVFSVMIMAVFLVYFRFVFGFFMRNFERQADGYVFTLFASARPLISTLQKIALASRQSADRPNWHHFSIRERIDFLGRCEEDRAWLARHDAKVRRGPAAAGRGRLPGQHGHRGRQAERSSFRDGHPAGNRKKPGKPQPPRAHGGSAAPAQELRRDPARLRNIPLPQGGQPPGAEQPGVAAGHLRRSSLPGPRAGAGTRVACRPASGILLHIGHACGVLFCEWTPCGGD